jgi:hypothetical protein
LACGAFSSAGTGRPRPGSVCCENGLTPSSSALWTATPPSRGWRALCFWAKVRP